MTTLENLRHGLNRAWHSVAEGWQHLSDRAAHALTRFTPVRHSGNVETETDRIAALGSRWGLITAEVHEAHDTITVRLEAPGMEREDFDVHVVDDRILVVRGEKLARREQTQGRYHLMECAYGSFERAVPLPAEVDESGGQANYHRGVLTISLPKRQAGSDRRRISVTAD